MEPLDLDPEDAEEREREYLLSLQEQKESIVDFFTKRELRLISNCREYAFDDPAGLPGHNLMMLVDKLVRYHGGALRDPDMLDEMIELASDSPPTP